MARYILDGETNGFLDVLDTIHSLVLKDVDTDAVHSCHDHYDYEPTVEGYPDQPTGPDIEFGLRKIMAADEIIGHNVIKFDIPAIKKVYPWFDFKGKVTDTLVLSRLIWADMKERDFAYRKTFKGKDFPGQMIGRHSLESWGIRMGLLKGDYSKECKEQGIDPWAAWNPAMQSYCEQDVEVTHALLKRIESMNWDERSVTLEHKFQEIIWMQEQHGFHFNVEAAQKLYSTLAGRREEIESQLQVTFPPEKHEMKSHVWVAPTGEVFDTKKSAVQHGYKGPDMIPGPKKFKMISFNPGSRDHIAKRLKFMGWKPQEFTPEGKPKVDETILSKLPYPEAEQLNEYLMVSKRIGQIAEGNQAWLKLEKNGRIHGGVITNGAVTGRCTHQRPNVAQTPSVKMDKEGNVKLGDAGGYGYECRELFVAPRGFKLVGADASGLELRCLAHYMAKYDDGQYIKLLLEGDIHTVNQLAAGLPTRNNAKTFIYAFLYGAGDQKIGSIVAPKASAKEQKRIGKKLKASFLKATPAIKRLREDVSHFVTAKDKNGKARNWLPGLDGRKLYVRSAHSALNLLLQSAGSLIVKQATVFLYEDLCRAGYVFGEDFANVAHIHDELQLIAREDIADEVGQRAVKAMLKAGEYFKFRCPTDGEYKVGATWADTH